MKQNTNQIKRRNGNSLKGMKGNVLISLCRNQRRRVEIIRIIKRELNSKVRKNSKDNKYFFMGSKIRVVIKVK